MTSREVDPETSRPGEGAENRCFLIWRSSRWPCFSWRRSHYVDTEDIAVKANELAPGKFTWIRYRDQINIHVIKTHLWDAKSERKGNLLIGSEKKDGWSVQAVSHELAEGCKP